MNNRQGKIAFGCTYTLQEHPVIVKVCCGVSWEICFTLQMNMKPNAIYVHRICDFIVIYATYKYTYIHIYIYIYNMYEDAKLK